MPRSSGLSAYGSGLWARTFENNYNKLIEIIWRTTLIGQRVNDRSRKNPFSSFDYYRNQAEKLQANTTLPHLTKNISN